MTLLGTAGSPAWATWLGLVGAWLLFAGPVYQATLELTAHEIARERIDAVVKGVAVPPKVSAWWWFVPPVKWFLERQRTYRYRTDIMQALDPVDLAALARYFDKATGWLLVAVGALLLAVKETWTSTHLGWLTAVIVLALLTLTALFVAARHRRTKSVIHRGPS